jgi:chromosome segregation protein
MRLKTIKLAGFKSFVDPTTVNLPSNMCAVVGPNGCGKSNIIDAVRWVMGESSAKNLRGEAMTDVIFNGSGSRKPVGQASIELIFDNSDATVKGEYAGYAEISVKRRVTRDGQNLYYLNGNRCRRRDITDIFLGTGLGPRSYAIIEQGMISRLIEAKPEELRVYIEEAAGISKYKERRKDTENRIRRTQENLERLTDIREELERQLSRLERQAKAAEKYSILKEEERSMTARLRGLRYRSLQQQSEQLKQAITEAELAIEAAVTLRVKHDTSIEKYREAFTEKSDKFNEIQANFYSVGTDIARIEQNIKHSQEREQTLRVDLEQTARDYKEAEGHLQLDSGKIEGWQAEIDEISPDLDGQEEVLEAAHEQLQKAEDAMQSWQQQWDSFNQRASEPKQAAEVQQSRIQYLEQVQQRLLQRQQKIESEAGDFDVSDDMDAISEEEEVLASLELELEGMEADLEGSSDTINTLKQNLDDAVRRNTEQQGELQIKKGRLASLVALQAAALGKENDQLSEWVTAQGIDPDYRLGEQIRVEAGWEKAAEVVLGDSLQAFISHKSVATFVDQLASLTSSVEVFTQAPSAQHADPALLAAKVQSDYALGHILADVYVADTVADAHSLLEALPEKASVVTKDGLWLSNAWLRVAVSGENQGGAISRKKEIDELEASIEALETTSIELQDQISDFKAQLQDHEQQRENTRKDIELKRRQAADQRQAISSRKSQIEQQMQIKERTESELRELKEQMTQESEHLAEARALLEQAISTIEADSEERETLLTQRDQLREQLDSARQTARHAQDRNHELAMRHRSIQTQLDATREGIKRLTEQLERLGERRDLLTASLEEAAAPGEDHQSELEALLDKRLSIEAKLTEARAELEETEKTLRETESARDKAERDIGEQRSALESRRLEFQTLEVKAQNILQQLQEDEFELDKVVAEIEDSDTESGLSDELTAIGERIRRLGPINLAAIDEYKTESERKTYLDEQNDDLCEALETLEGAIRKIDKETRTRFKETYDQVNGGLQNLFPQLFGGGHAYLELTGEDLLDTGIAIMARPPGKKNSTIHLLSGGEKALTAIALVFSIFHLNPAPFCMLDEVDAPLDDANVGRYANIVEKMSEQVQFIFITHNKIAMEKAQHLMGVTMQEAGVSRMVTVDVEEAAELAAI